MRPSVPDLKSVIPFPDDLWLCLLFTVVAHSPMSWVFLDEFQTFCLGVQDVFVFSVDLGPGFTVMSFRASSAMMVSSSVSMVLRYLCLDIILRLRLIKLN